MRMWLTKLQAQLPDHALHSAQTQPWHVQVSAELPSNDLFNLLDTAGIGHLTLDQLLEGMLNLRRVGAVGLGCFRIFRTDAPAAL